jgi:hypothetical protein
MNNPLFGMSEVRINDLIAGLDSLAEGDLAVDMLIACGKRAVPYLDHFLLGGSPRTIALPRCRAVHALAELAACPTLISYFRGYKRPTDAAVLFAEDAVRSAVACELLRWKTDEVFDVLLDAAKERATSDLVLALGEFRRPQSIPLLFDVLEDDLCREEAKGGLRKVPDAARQYAILSIRGSTSTTLDGPSALRRRRATLQLLREFGVLRDEWDDIRPFLLENDPDILIAVAQIGATAARSSDQPQIVSALLNVSDKLNWLQERDVMQLMDTHHEIAYETALRAEQQRRDRGEQVKWLSPFWRILRHVLNGEWRRDHHGAA